MSNPRDPGDYLKDDNGRLLRCCLACGQFLPQDVQHFYFRINGKSRDGSKRASFSSRCRPCEKEYKKKFRDEKRMQPPPKEAPLTLTPPSLDWSNLL